MMAALRDVACLLLFYGVITRAASRATPPNIVFILADDLGWNDVSFHGSNQIPTPNLDALAYDGVMLSQNYVQPLCTPSRSALLTGRHPIHTGMQHNTIDAAQPYGLGLDQKLLPQYLNELGYTSHIVGKWHLGFFEESYLPTERGFESHYGYYQGREDYYDHSYCPYGPKDPKVWGLDFHRNKDIVRTAFGQYSTELFTTEAESIIKNHNTTKPLFLYIAHQAVHGGNPHTKNQLEAPWKYLRKFSYIKNKPRRIFAAMVSALDDSVGNVTRALHTRGMLNDTIIIFSTDNGGPVVSAANNWPLRGVKESVWEGGVRGAGFIWSPRLKHAPYTFNGMIQIFDWLPTILAAAGYDMDTLPDDLDGINQWETLSENRPPIRMEMLHNIDDIENTAGLRVGDMKLVVSNGGTTKSWPSWYAPDQYFNDFSEYDTGFGSDGDPDLKVEGNLDFKWDQLEEAPGELFETDIKGVLEELGRTGQINPRPLVVKCGPRPANVSTNCEVGKNPCVFNITADPCEFNNLAHSRPDVLSDLLGRLGKYRSTAVPPRNKPDDPAGFPCYHNWEWVPWVKNDKN